VREGVGEEAEGRVRAEAHLLDPLGDVGEDAETRVLVDAVVGRVERVEEGREGCEVGGDGRRAGVRAELVEKETGGLVGHVVVRGHGDGTCVVYRCAAGEAGAGGEAGAAGEGG
jgi:hypothetical protein